MAKNFPAAVFSSRVRDNDIVIYDRGGAENLRTEFEKLYQNIFSSTAVVEAAEDLADCFTYVRAQTGKVRAALLFKKNANSVRVLNQVFFLSLADIEFFAKSIFSAFPTVSFISFEAIQTEAGALPKPFQRYNCTENIVATLPASEAIYFESLGNNMRNSLKKYRKKISKEIEGFQVEIFERNDISEEHVRAIVALSASRMEKKAVLSSHTDKKTADLIRLVHAYGSVLVASVNGRVCGGVICTHYGGNAFMHVVAHDPLYDKYRIGKVCAYLSILSAINKGLKEYHFLWGKYEYKYRLMGVQRDYDRLVMYRSWLYLARRLPHFIQIALRGMGRRIKGHIRQLKLKAEGNSLRCLWQRLAVRPNILRK